jgi:Ca-activated chloride channel family protein
MKRATLLTLLLIFVLGAMSTTAQDIPCGPCPPDAECLLPECIPPVGGVFTNPDWLKIDHHRVTVTVEDQVAHTEVSMEFVNEGEALAEGTFVFPLPLGASVDQLVMYINDQPIEARILEADEARSIYDEIVRQYRDPALLEYVGTQAVQANIFPIPPGETRRIELAYSQVLEADSGLIHYTYPLDVTRLTSRRPIEEMSISVLVDGSDPISAIYSPSHNIAINRGEDETRFSAGFEQSFFVPDQDFSLYWGIDSENINVNLLSYREDANDDGFFMLLVQPPLELPEDQIQPRDIIVVLDQSGSMEGPKWEQAQDAANYVLENLNPRDRFNVILFSTGWRVFSGQLESPDAAPEAVSWINSMYPEGGTDINGALLTALDMADAERPTTILFLTDGLPTEGESDPEAILENIEGAARSNVRIFAFGVGDDVDTFLLDSITSGQRGLSSYVRPTERVDEEVQSLYNKIGAPVLTDVQLTINGVTADSIYPEVPLPDLFAGTQLTLVGRYRGSADRADIQLSGTINGERQTFVYDDLSFRARAGGEPFIARLWATRRIGELLNSIRLNGENQELVDSIVSLSVRYGIITPYTSFLIEEDDILSQTARDQAASEIAAEAADLRASSSGAAAVGAADAFGNLAQAEAPAPMIAMPTMTAGGEFDEEAIAQAAAQNPIRTVGDKTFIQQNGIWTDTTFDPDTMETQKVVFLSDDYFALLDSSPALGEYFALGDRVIVVVDGTAYEVVTE